MIPKQYRGSPPSKTPSEILALLQNGSHTLQEVTSALPSNRKPRSVRYHLELLRQANKVEMFVTIGDLRKPRYRLVRE